MFDKIKQLKELRDQANELKNRMSEITVSGKAMDDKIVVVMDGNQEIIGIDIDKSLLTEDNKEKLEDGLKSASNEATKKVKSEMAKQFQQGNFKMPNLGM